MSIRTFNAGDKVVYPPHGVGEVQSVITRTFAGTEQIFINIMLLEKGTKLMVPLAQAEANGLRKLLDKKALEKVYEILRNRSCKIDTQTWNRRHREYTQKLNTGSLFEIAEVLRDLAVLSADKELSFGERNMLESAQNRLVEEIALIKSRTRENVIGEIQQLFA